VTTSDPRYLTGDRTPQSIVDGLKVWTNDLDLGTVDLAVSGVDRPHWDGWFRLVMDGGGTSLANGERMAVLHPFTRMPTPAMRSLTMRQWDRKIELGTVATSATMDAATVAEAREAHPDWTGEHWCQVDDVMVPCNVLPPPPTY